MQMFFSMWRVLNRDQCLCHFDSILTLYIQDNNKVVYLYCSLLVSISHCEFPLLYKSIYKRLLVVSNLGTFLISQKKGQFVSILARIKLAPPSSTLNGRRKICAPRRRKLNDEERHLATKPDIGCRCTSIHFLGKKYGLSIAASRSFQRWFV